MQVRRTEKINQMKMLIKIFGHSIKEEYHIPFTIKIFTIIKLFFKRPIITILGIIFKFISDRIQFKSTKKQNAKFWEPIGSTKKAINLLK